MIELTEIERHHVAIHEAGHTVIGLVLGLVGPMIALCGTKAASRDLCPRRRIILRPGLPNEAS